MFPSPAQPVHAVFVYRRLVQIARRADLRILVPVPWFPFIDRLPRYRWRARLPREATVGELHAEFPRFLSIPRFFKSLDGVFAGIAVWRAARRIRREFPFELVDAHLAYPDGYAGLQVARRLGIPLTVTLRGHDINDFPAHPGRRRQIVEVLRAAGRVMSVADALRRAAVALGAPAERTETVPNGVETRFFQPLARGAAREALGLPQDRRIVVAVGHLVERKGQYLVVEALAELRRAGHVVPLYVIVGGAGEEGNHRPEIERRIAAHGLERDVLLVGPKQNEDLGTWYSAADVMCLASSKEGWANVLLESLACGTPVVATDVWGTPEVIRSPAYGVLVQRTPASIAAGLTTALTTTWDRDAMVRYARTFSWEDVGARVVHNYELALAGGKAP
jgi:glycosyltransferase involved in cell wall biosynthesis